VWVVVLVVFVWVCCLVFDGFFLVGFVCVFVFGFGDFT